MSHHWIRIVATFLITGLLLVAAVFWNEARKEAFYLCGNFISGVTKASVLRQLETSTLSDFEEHLTATGSTITFSSPMTARAFRCVIEIGSDDLVIRAYSD